MILDILILVVVLAALFIGYRFGTVQPVFAFVGFVLVVIFVLGRWSSYSRYLDQHVHSNGVIDALVLFVVALVVGYGAWKLGGFVHKMPVVRGVDGLLGVVVCGLIAIWLLYGLISLAVALGMGFGDTIGQASTTPAQAQAISTWVAGNPVLRHAISASEVTQLQAAAKTPNNPDSAISNFPSLNQLQAIYRVFCAPQLERSRLAPIVMWIGQHTPILGHSGPADLPRPTPSPTVSPSATPTP